MVDAAWLRALGADRLADLLRNRPDATAPPVPGSLTELAERLSTRKSTDAALRRLNRPTLQVAEAIAALGGRADRAALDRLIGPASAESRAAVDQALGTLRERALLTGGELVELVPTLAAWPNPLGLGVPLAEALSRRTAYDLQAIARNIGRKPGPRKAETLAKICAVLQDGDLVHAMVDQAPAEARELLHKVAASGEVVEDYYRYSPDYYYSRRYSSARTPAHWAIAHGLLVRADEWESALIMPTEVAMALRGPSYTAPFDPAPPEVDRIPVDLRAIDRNAAAAGSAMLRLIGGVLDEAGRSPLATVRSGGVGTREMSRLAKRLGSAERDLRLAVALAVQAELLSTGAGQAAPTAGYDRWLRNEPAVRLAELLRVWWHMPYAPLAANSAITTGSQEDGTATLRAALLATAGQPPRTSVSDFAAMAALAIWQRPLAYGDPDSASVRALACWQEAGMLGVVARGAVSAAGRALVEGAEDLAAALGDIGEAQRTVRLQADLTAVVTGTPAAELTALLDLACDSETRGTASTWRFSPASIRRALDAGRTAKGLLDELEAVSVGGLPQPLEYLIAEVARRHGVVRASAVACCLRSDDTALLAEIAADRRLRSLRLRQLAPTVLVADMPLPDALAALRKAGYAPVAETADGTPVIEQAAAHRITPPTKPRPPLRHKAAPSGVDFMELAQSLLAAPDEPRTPPSPSLSSVRAGATNLTSGECAILAHAIDHHRPIAIEYVNSNGNQSSRVIDPGQLAGNSLLAWCRLRDDERFFILSGIIAVEPAE